MTRAVEMKVNIGFKDCYVSRTALSLLPCVPSFTSLYLLILLSLLTFMSMIRPLLTPSVLLHDLICLDESPEKLHRRLEP